MAISAAPNWIVCERSGRWSAALRTAFSRLPEPQPIPRLYELRTLGELSTHLDEHRRDLALIEVGRENLTEVLKLLMHCPSQYGQFVALLDRTEPQRRTAATIAAEPDMCSVIDLLREAGATEVVESPRQLRGLMALHARLATARDLTIGRVAERHSFADWAWSTLPWQDS